MVTNALSDAIKAGNESGNRVTTIKINVGENPSIDVVFEAGLQVAYNNPQPINQPSPVTEQHQQVESAYLASAYQDAMHTQPQTLSSQGAATLTSDTIIANIQIKPENGQIDMRAIEQIQQLGASGAFGTNSPEVANRIVESVQLAMNELNAKAQLQSSAQTMGQPQTQVSEAVHDTPALVSGAHLNKDAQINEGFGRKVDYQPQTDGVTRKYEGAQYDGGGFTR